MSQVARTRPRPVVIEVTNTLQARSTTGYQRFVRELVRALQTPGTPALDVLPVVWDGGAYRRLLPLEQRVLRDGPPPAAGAAVRALRKGVRLLRAPRLRVGDLPQDAVFLDAEPAWHDPEPRAELLPRLRAEGVTVVSVVTDVLPELRPEWFEPRMAGRFHDWLLATLRSSELCLAISAFTSAALADVAAQHGVEVPPTVVVQLGADFDVAGAQRPVELPFTDFLLVVGTLEPRKNQALALDLLERLADHPELGLVLVGKQGWLVEELVARIRSHPLLGSRLVWLSGLGDDELAWLYVSARLALVPSWSEGLGLPVLEALQHGVPVIASTGGALREAGGGVAEHAEPGDLDEWERLVRRHLEDPAHASAVRAAVRAHTPPTWAAAGQVFRELLAAAPAVRVGSA